MASGGGTAVAKKASAPKKSKAPSHPPYSEMVKVALISLKERTGSSHQAIAKHIEEQQKVTLPSNFKKLLSVQLKRLVASGKLVKVKNSFKIAPVQKQSTEEAKPKPKAKPASKSKEVTEKKAKKPVANKEKAKKAPPAKAKGETVTKKPKAVAKPVKKDKAVKAAAKSPAKKMAASKVMKAKKPKSIKSPVKKAPATKRARK